MAVKKNTPAEQNPVQSTEVKSKVKTNMTKEELKQYVQTDEFKNMSASDQLKKIKELTGHTAKQGRPIDPNSARQKKLRNKVPGAKQGRPVDPNSARQQRLKEQAMKLLGVMDTTNTEEKK